MNAANTERLRSLLDKPLGELTVGEAIFVLLVGDEATDKDMADLVGYTEDE